MLPHQETPRGLRARASAIEANAARAEADAEALEAWPAFAADVAKAPGLRAHAARLYRAAADYRAKADKAEAAALRQPWPASRPSDEARSELRRLCEERAEELAASE